MIPCNFIEKSNCIFGTINVYTCRVSNQIIAENEDVSFKGTHTVSKVFKRIHTNKDVYAMKFENSIIPRIPQKLETHFKNIHILVLNNCGLKTIVKEDLKSFKELTVLELSNNDLTELPVDLFSFSKNLKKVSFADNKLLTIPPQIFDCVKSLQAATFAKNPGLNLSFNEKSKFEEFKWMIKELNYCMKIKEFQNKFTELKEEYQQLENLTLKVDTDIVEDISNLLMDENQKDFTFIVDDEEFEVHKFIFMARSKLFCELMQQNPDTDVLNIEDIPVELFKQIIDFVYTDETPNDDSDFLKIFAAASKLKIEKLRNLAAQKLIAKLTYESAYDCLVICRKYGHEGLKEKAFGEIKKVFPTIPDELSDELEKLLKIIQAREILMNIEKI